MKNQNLYPNCPMRWETMNSDIDEFLSAYKTIPVKKRMITMEINKIKELIEEYKKALKSSAPFYLGDRIYPSDVTRRMRELQKWNYKMAQLKVSSKLRVITDPFAVLDCLGGYITGDYQEDLKRATEQRGATFEYGVYCEAYQMDQQP